MRNSRVRCLVAFTFYFSFMQVLLAQPIDSAPLPSSELIKALQSGGHIIYMRHSQTDHKQKDQGATSLEHCDLQRNLSVAGREMAQSIGSAIKRLNIPIEDVLSSPYCRCKDTAKLAFGDFKIEPNLQFSFSKNDKESKKLGEKLYEMMMSDSNHALNSVFVGHTSNLRDGLGVWPKPEGAVAIFQKLEGRIIYKGLIKPNEWPIL